MSRINDLIRELCPGGVESRALGETGEFIRGRRITKDDFVESGVGCIHYGEIYTRYGTAATETYSFVRPELAARLRLARTGDLIIAATGENAEEVCKAVAWLGTDEIAIHDDCYLYRHTFDPTYVSFLFQSSLFRDQKIRYAAGAKMVRVSGERLAKIRVPVPPLAVQREVVVVLSEMEAVEAELASQLRAEQEARRRQYVFHRDSLLAFEPRERERESRWATLSEVIDLDFGTRITKRKDAGSLHPVYGGGGESFRTDGFNREDEYVISRFAMSETCVRKVTGKFWMLDSGFTFDPVDESVSKHYVAQILFSRQAEIYACSSQGAQKNIRIDEFKKIRIPVPPLEEQKRIVEILDRFDAVMNNLSVELPAELRSRRQQYEHYRDRLLTFDQAAA